MFLITEHEVLAPKVHRLQVEAPLVAQKAQPGQFVILVVDEKGERVPFTISDWDTQRGTVDFVFIEVGRTTRQLALLKEGSHIAHFMGPLGRPAQIDHFGHVVAIVSGYGIAAIVPILRALKEKDNRITTIVHAPRSRLIFGKDRLEAFSDRLLLAIAQEGDPMMDSSTIVLRDLLKRHPADPIDRVVAMSSLCLMRVICDTTRPLGIKTMVHLTPVMVDGTGMCGACRVSVRGSTKFACVHGPEFDGHEVEKWEVLMARRCSYADESVLQQGFQCCNCSQW